MKNERKPSSEQQESFVDVPAGQSARALRLKLWAELLKTTALALAALCIIVLGSVAWFVSNSRVDSSGITISYQYDTIRLATKGKRQSAEEKLLNLPEGETFSDGDDPYYYTENGTIALRLSEDNIVVSPGASGTVTFYIIPTRDGAMSLTLYVGLAGYNTSGQRVINSTLDALLSGHILLFRNKDLNGHYSDWLGENNTITVSLQETAEKDKPVEVTLYWVWPLRYENMVGDLYEKDSAEYQDSFALYIANQSKIGSMTPIAGNYRYSRIFLTNETGETLQDPSKAYNLADEYIGTNAQYLYLAIQTAEVSARTN